MRVSQDLIDPRKLQARRIRARLTGPALAERAGLCKATISALERGQRRGSLETLGLIADVLGCDITDLMPDETAAQITAYAGKQAA